MLKEVVLSMCAFSRHSNEEAVNVNTDGFCICDEFIWNTLDEGFEQAILVSETLTTFGSGLFTDLQSSASSCAWPGCDLSLASALR